MTPNPAPAVTAPERLVIASRESRLAMWQARFVQQRLAAAWPDCDIRILGMTTEGDRVLDRALNEIGGKGLFTKELELAMLDGRADLAVHSLKDVPMELPEGFSLTAVMRREDPRDALVSGRWSSLADLPHGAVLGTSSLRRAAQIRHRYPHLQIRTLRGNLDTRLAKLDRGEYDAIVLAAAGLKRLGLADRIREVLPPTLTLPAAGQGALGIETLASRPSLGLVLAPLADAETLLHVSAERAVSRALGGSCRVPLAAYCETTADGALRLRACVASVDGDRLFESEASAMVRDVAEALTLGASVADDLLSQGAQAFLRT